MGQRYRATCRWKGRLFGGVRAPPALGTFLRSFTRGTSGSRRRCTPTPPATASRPDSMPTISTNNFHKHDQTR